MLALRSLTHELADVPRARASGKVIGIRGPVIFARIPQVAMGDLCYVQRRGQPALPAQVVAFQDDKISLAPLDAAEGIGPGAVVTNTGAPPRLKISDALVGSVVDALGLPLEPASQDTALNGCQTEIVNAPPNPLQRVEISTQLVTGVKVLDGVCSLGYGQRIGLFAGAGVGKSTLLGMIARNAAVDITVIALVGERGREVREFITDSLGPEGLKRSILVVATSDETPLRRRLAAMTATAIAEHYRSQGKRVLLLVDSLTRMARAIREVGLAAGELPVRQGYTSSVYTELPRLLERAGTDQHGSITAIYTVLTNGDNEVDPLGEEIKSILDGHVVMSNAVVQQGIRPAVDITTSISRLLPRLHEEGYRSTIETVVRLMGRIKKDKDLVLLGGTPDPELKAALELEPELVACLTQRPNERWSMAQTRQMLVALAAEWTARSKRVPA